MNRTMMLLAAPLLLGTTGCYPWFLFDDFEDTEEPIPVPPPQQPNPTGGDQTAPTISVNAPSWPPIGPDSSIEVTVRDEGTVSSLEVRFAETTFFNLSGTQTTQRLTGFDLGEGYGSLQLEAQDFTGNARFFTVENFLVDLSPPEVILGGTVLGKGPGRYFEFWAADAWILGDVEVAVEGVPVYFEDFEDGYPGTVGNDWDLSLVRVPTLELPGGMVEASVTLHDAAGNEHLEYVSLEVDGDPPLVSIVSPAPNAQVSGVFEVQLTASDVGGGPAWLQVEIAGTPVATAVGPEASVFVDTTDLTPGDWELVAIAIDEAGLETTASIPITIVAP